MSIGLPPVGASVRPLARRSLQGPPAEAIAEVREAAACAARLHERGQEVRFERDPDSGRWGAELRTLDGTVVRRLPLGEVLELSRGID